MDQNYTIGDECHLIVESNDTFNEERVTTPSVTSEPKERRTRACCPHLPPCTCACCPDLPLDTCGDRIYLIFILAVYTLGIGNIVLGIIYVNDCPAEEKIPIGIIIFGAIFLVGRLLNRVYNYLYLSKNSEDECPTGLIVLTVSFVLAGIGMFIALCYWVFTLDPTTKPEDHALKNYCSQTFLSICYWECLIILFFIVGACSGGRCYL